MRKLPALVLAVLFLLVLPGCGGPESAIKGYIQDVADFINLYKQIKVKDSPRKPPPNPASFKARIEAHVEGMKRIKDLSEEDRLALQIKYGPAVMSISQAFAQRLEQVKGMGAPLGFDGLEGCEKLLLDPDALIVTEGYEPMAKVATKSINELLSACAAIKNAQQAQEAIPRLRQLRYRLTLDAVKLKHLEPPQNVTVGRDKEQVAVKEQTRVQTLASLSASIRNLEAAAGQLRALDSGAADAIEPLPDYYKTLASK
jgi:hypothetical protein